MIGWGYVLSGDGHQRSGLPGVGRSTFGRRLQAPAADVSVLGRDVIAITSVRGRTYAFIELS